MSELLAGLLGAILALLGEGTIDRVRKAVTARKLAKVFERELRGVQFSASGQPPTFAGFSSQTLDSLFREVAECLPDDLAMDLMSYHWRMKFLEEAKGAGTLQAYGGFVTGASTSRDELLARLQRFAGLSVPGLILKRQERQGENAGG